MKWLHLLAIGFLALAFDGCQQHSASELLLIKMPGEDIKVAPEKKNAPDSATPADNSKPSPGYL
jgi:hypothetical protein